MDTNKILLTPYTINSYLSIFVFLCMCITAACTSDAEETKVLEAARIYAQQNTDVAVNVQAESILEDYARVRVIPKNPGEADDALMYLKKEKDKWKGISMGTGFSPDDFEALGIPEKIR